MSVRLAQILAIMRYELKMIWRGRTLIVLLLSLLALCIINALVVSNARSSLGLLADGSGSDTAGLGMAVVFLSWSPLGITLALIVPIMFADLIPKDTQLGTRELLDTLPLSPGTYLAGKLAGVWLSLILGISAVMVITGGVWWATLGAYDLGPYLKMAIFGAWVLIVINTGMAVLLTAGQPGRRRAVSLMLLVFIGIPVFTAAGSMSNPDQLIWMLGPIRPAVLNYFLKLDITEAQLLLTIGIGLLEVFITWLVVREWLKWRNQRV